MISFLEGKIEHLGEKYIILNTGSVGYKVIVSPKLLSMLANRKPYVNAAEDPESLEGKSGVNTVKLFTHSQMNMRLHQ